jgi:Tol biopolymer transport system component
MRNKNLLIGGLMCVLVLLVVFTITSKSQKPTDQAKPETILIGIEDEAKRAPEGTSNIAPGHPPDTIRGYDIIEIGQGSTPRFSPDSKKIAFLSGGWLCIRNSDGTGVIDKIAPMSAIDFQWMSDSSIIYWNQEGYGTPKISRNIGIVNLKGEKKPAITEPEGTQMEPPMLLPDGTIGYYKHNLVNKTQSFVVIKPGTLPPDSALKQLIPRIKFETTYVMYGDIWLVSLDGSYKRWVTFNKRFGFPEMSPDGKKIIATKIPGKDPYEGGGPYIIDLKGHETYVGDPDKQIPKLDSSGHPVTGRWATEASAAAFAKFSPDGSKVVYMYGRTAMDIEDIETSDLVIKNVDGTGRFQIETPNEIEFYPTWSPNGKMIACQTYNTNKIYVFRLK